MNLLDSLLVRFRRWVLLVLVALWVTAFVASHVPGSDLPEFRVGDKTLHVIGFMGLTGTFLVALRAYGKCRWYHVGLVLPIMMLYGAFDEITQEMTRQYFGRTGDVRDWLADMLGTVIAMVLWGAVVLVLARETHPPAKPSSE
jgi:VanZ family protein